MENNEIKECRKKIYEIYVCMPPIGTCVINKLEQAQVVQQCEGRTYFTVREMQQIQQQNPQMYQFLMQNAYIVSEKKRFVLCGMGGELWCIGDNKLAKTYVFAADGGQIDPASLKQKIKDGVIDWTKVRTREDSGTLFARFVPLGKQEVVLTSWGDRLLANDPSVNMHGKGDFILYSSKNGQPDLSDSWVVNGAVFKATYNNSGWTDCLDNTDYTSLIDMSKLPKLWESGEGAGSDTLKVTVK